EGGIPQGGNGGQGGVPQGGSGGAGGEGGAGGSGGDGGEGGEGGGPPQPSCTPMLGAPVDERCGHYVDAGAPAGGDGSMAAPFQTLAEAIAAGGDTSYYVCSSTGLAESVTVANGSTVYGNISCTGGWEWADIQSNWQAPVGLVALNVSGNPDAFDPNVKTHIEGFAIFGGETNAAAKSSVAIAASYASVDLVNVEVWVDDGFAGEDGVNGVDATPNGAAGDGGDGTTLNCGPNTSPGGAAGVSSCGRNGGRGGGIIVCTVGNGLSGQGSQNNGGQGGTTCTAGGNGTNGTNGFNGADGTLGFLTLGPGIIEMDGVDGTAGAHGVGGGGGGALLYDGETDHRMAGGGGGAAGCGGTAGTAGKSGGSSIAIVSISSLWTFTDVSVSVGMGADGGVGGTSSLGSDGNPGGEGATAVVDTVGFPPAPVTASACDGGSGGRGGNGGSGGNGAGGHSAIIAYREGMSPNVSAITVLAAPMIAGQGPGTAPEGVATDVLNIQ
ncbi:MAG: hypothetical protein HOW73_30375, partial [Polyangiaceae bacterium]|nr:hypothetical protein [Polyangiaceae bacterium]